MSAPVRLRIDRSERDGAALVRPDGVLNLATYAELRDTLIKCAVEQPRALVVDLGSLWVPTDATLAVFATVWMRVSEWPGIPIVLVVPDPEDRHRLRHRAITRFLPLHASVDEALARLTDPPPCRRRILQLPCDSSSAAVARRFTGETCERWGCVQLRAEAIMVASELVENAVRHARSEPRLGLELRGEMLTVAVYDDDPVPVRLVEPEGGARRHLGLWLVSRLASAWNHAPTWSGGKVVWAALRCLAQGR